LRGPGSASEDGIAPHAARLELALVDDGTTRPTGAEKLWASFGQTTAMECGLGLGNDDIAIVRNAIDKQLLNVDLYICAKDSATDATLLGHGRRSPPGIGRDGSRQAMRFTSGIPLIPAAVQCSEVWCSEMPSSPGRAKGGGLNALVHPETTVFDV
jgi:hypothetical protein